MTDPTPDERLRALLDEAVSDVEPRPALDAIRERTKVTPMSIRRPWIFAAAGAVAATVVTVAAVGVLTDGDPRNAGAPAANPSPTVRATDEPPPTPTERPSPTGPSAGTHTLPVYYVAETSTGPRLFREFHRLESEDTEAGRVRVALEEALGDTALDPEYHSGWPAGSSVAGVDVDGPGGGAVVTIDLSGTVLHDRPGGMSEAAASIAVEQLIHTAQAVLQRRAPVQFLLDGGHTDTVLGVPTSEPLAEGDPMEVQGTVWVISPQDGAVVTSPFRVEGRGAFFEANVSWQLLQAGEVVDEGFTTAEEGMTLSAYSFDIDVAPGDYVLRVYDADMSGGEGSGEAEDTKRITVH